MARRRRSRNDRDTKWMRSDTNERSASLRAHWRADGAPKTAYRSQREALSVADERRQEAGVELHVYRCGVCTCWHLGNPDAR